MSAGSPSLTQARDASSVPCCHRADPGVPALLCPPAERDRGPRGHPPPPPRPLLPQPSRPTRGRAAPCAHQRPGSPPRYGQRGQAPVAEAEAARQRGPSFPQAVALRRESSGPGPAPAPARALPLVGQLVENGNSGTHPAARRWGCAGAAVAVPALAGSTNPVLHSAASRSARPRRQIDRAESQSPVRNLRNCPITAPEMGCGRCPGGQRARWRRGRGRASAEAAARASAAGLRPALPQGWRQPRQGAQPPWGALRAAP